MACRVCTILNGNKPADHVESRLHTNAPAVPIARVVTAGPAHIKARRAG